ncbi:MAG TPA: glycoside hydrolase family 3 C-terminal domain-containing protein, partial [Aggregatilineales bacterium]|nr:glycoside hydrolase family 3 C-terminal domain-containing protein [Aggregatilineales bacterium]
ADLVIMGHLPDQMALHQSLRSMTRPESLARIQSARLKTPASLPPLEVVGCADHQRIAQTIADRSITIVRYEGQLPLHPGPDDRIAVITPTPTDLTPADTSSRVEILLAEAIRQRHPKVVAFELPPQASSEQIAAVAQAVAGAYQVIVGTINAVQDPSQANLVQALYQRGQPPIVVALRTPYDLTVFPMIKTYLCAYGIRPVTMEAVARVLLGEIEPTGILPCTIPGI